MNARRMAVREHLRPKPRRRLSRPELEVALEWTRPPEPDPHGWWWSPTSALPAPYVAAFATWGQA